MILWNLKKLLSYIGTESCRPSLNMTLEQAYSRRLPIFGPLNIKSSRSYLEEAKITFNEMFNGKFPFLEKIQNFELLYFIGEGAFGKVMFAEKRRSKSPFAIKALKKKRLVKRGEVEEALNEKRLLQSLNNPFCIRLEFMVQDNSYVYFVLPFISGGSVFTCLQHQRKFDENLARFYASQVVLALEYLHFLGLAYRDLKLENLLIDHLGYLKLTDFGFTKRVATRTYTFCGTPDYIAPEVVIGRGHDKAVDWWALGVLIYEMLSGRSPFHDSDSLTMYSNIVKVQYSMPQSFSAESKDIVKKFLQYDVTKRLGNLQREARDVKKHSWFKTTEWRNVLNRKVIPPYFSCTEHSLNISNFPNLKKYKKMKISKFDRYKDSFTDF